MRVAIDVSPLKSGHKVRGTGFYLKNLKENLEKIDKDLIFFENIKEVKDVDLIHFPYFDPFFLTLPGNSNIPYVVTVHDLTPLVFPKDFPPGVKGRLKWQIQKRRLKKSKAIITDSNASKKDIVRILKYPQENIHVVYLAASEKFKPFNESEKQKIKKKYDLPERYALYVGDATANKNVLRLFEAIEKVEIPLVVIGKALSDENITPNAWNEELRKAQGIAKNSRFIKRLGFVEENDLPKIYSAASVFAFPSLYEGFGLPVIEAMASGTPVVTTQAGSLKEVAGNCAYFVDPLDVNSIAQGIKEVFENQKLQDDFSKLGIKNAERFSWQKTAKETLEVYEKVFEEQ